MAREPVFITPDIRDEILERLSQGESLRSVCRGDTMPDEAAVRKLALKDEIFGPQYTHARELGYLAMADEMLEISDDGSNDWMLRVDPKNPGYDLNGEHIQRSRQRVDTRKWLLSKCLPKIYGDKVELSGPNGGPAFVLYGERESDNSNAWTQDHAPNQK